MITDAWDIKNRYALATLKTNKCQRSVVPPSWLPLFTLRLFTTSHWVATPTRATKIINWYQKQQLGFEFAEHLLCGELEWILNALTLRNWFKLHSTERNFDLQQVSWKKPNFLYLSKPISSFNTWSCYINIQKQHLYVYVKFQHDNFSLTQVPIDSKTLQSCCYDLLYLSKKLNFITLLLVHCFIEVGFIPHFFLSPTLYRVSAARTALTTKVCIYPTR